MLLPSKGSSSRKEKRKLYRILFTRQLSPRKNEEQEVVSFRRVKTAPYHQFLARRD